MAKVLLTFGPLVGIVDAVSWQDYLGGIIQHHCSSGEANHAVIITGFDKTGSTPYWIVRNSWGSSWGVDGYAHVKMGRNICEKLGPKNGGGVNGATQTVSQNQTGITTITQTNRREKPTEKQLARTIQRGTLTPSR
uniref:Cathepsin O n=1 Tax=Molossus molossus TaxID=27622 RepID=A0A7J8I5L7_MOLMO|nr:cathepsin O [Molossus molossus]